MPQKRLFFQGPSGRLQALYHAGRNDRPAVAVCHPHPLFGGSMRNKVVYWMARAFADQGCAVLRFNFRGVDLSEGTWDEGEGEVEDAAAAVNWLAGEHRGCPLWLAGFSFGCYAGLKAASGDERIERLFAVAPAVNRWDFSFMQGDARPLTVVIGTVDEVVPPAAVGAWAASLPSARLHAIEGAGHFFPGHMPAMQAALLADVSWQP